MRAFQSHLQFTSEYQGGVTSGDKGGSLKTSQEAGAGGGGTFTGGRSAVVFQVGAVLAFVVVSTLAEIVAGTVVALGAILAWVGLTIIYVQLQGAGWGKRKPSKTKV